MSSPKSPKKKTVAQIERAEAGKPPATGKREKKVGRHRRANYSSYGSYTRRLLGSSHPEVGINKSANEMINRFVDEFLRAVGNKVSILLDVSRHRTVKDSALRGVVLLQLGNELGSEAVKDAESSVAQFEGASKGGRRSARAGLVYPISRTEKRVRQYLSGNKRFGSKAAVFLAASVQYLVSRFLDSAAMVTSEKKKTRITPRYLKLGISNDELLSAYIASNDYIVQGGVEPKVHEVLLPKSRKSKKSE